MYTLHHGYSTLNGVVKITDVCGLKEIPLVSEFLEMICSEMK